MSISQRAFTNYEEKSKIGLHVKRFRIYLESSE